MEFIKKVDNLQKLHRGVRKKTFCVSVFPLYKLASRGFCV
jgi:hypothetical protein